MKKSELRKADKCLRELKSILQNDFEILKMADTKEFNFSYLKATIGQIEEVNKSINLLGKYFEKKKIRF